MATVTRENIGLLNEKIVVKVAKDDYLPSFEKAIKSYSKQANIPGFRKGMVPAGMVKKMYGSSVFADEVLKSVEKGLSDYMVNEKLEIFAQPLPLPENDASKLNMSNPAEYAFAFEVGLKPEFTIADLGTATLTRYKVTPTEESINDEIDRLRTRNGKMTDPESVTSDENVLNVTFSESDADGNEMEGGIKKDNSLLVKYFGADFRSSLVGKKNNDSFVIQPSKAFEEKERDFILKDLGLEQKDADKYFLVLITKVGLIEKTELNEEFFKTAYPDKEIATEADFRNAVKEDIQKYWDAQSRNQLSDQVYHLLLSHTNIIFPESFLKRWMQNGGENPKTAEQVETEYPSFINSLKWTLIVDQLVKNNNIEVKQEDLREFAKQQLLSYMGGNAMGMDQPWVNDYIDRMMKDKKFVEDSYHRIQTDKIFTWAETQVNPTEKEILPEAFTKMAEEHHHHH
ncbi:MAG TPA: trigger factor [Chitinophagaceae bacterium]|jgi:trigger factor|nr:trigger factor [Chitinophagaceae bacterium]